MNNKYMTYVNSSYNSTIKKKTLIKKWAEELNRHRNADGQQA